MSDHIDGEECGEVGVTGFPTVGVGDSTPSPHPARIDGPGGGSDEAQ